MYNAMIQTGVGVSIRSTDGTTAIISDAPHAMLPEVLLGKRPPHPSVERLGIFALARRFMAEREVDTAAGRDACLALAAELFVGSAGAAQLVTACREEFASEFAPDERLPPCGNCGARMHEASANDTGVTGSHTTIWKCGHCGRRAFRIA
jgi:hypothetical protein